MKGQKVTIQNGQLQVPNDPIIPFIEGDGTGPDIWAASVRVLDAAVEKAYARLQDPQKYQYARACAASKQLKGRNPIQQHIAIKG